MERNLKRISRALALAVVAVMLASVVPTYVFNAPIVENAAAADNIVNIGYLNFEVQNWNPLCIEMVEDYVACYLMYSALFTYDEDWNGPVNDLATGYYFDVHPDGSMTTYINITENAYFRNAANPTDMSQQLTAADVVYTFNTIKDNVGKTWDWYLEECFNFTAVTDHQFSVDTPYAKATLIDDLSGIPIVCADVWSAMPNPVAAIQPGDNMGTSAFYYDSMAKDSWYLFRTAPNYHGATDWDRTVDIDGLMYVVYTEATAVALALESGSVDTITLAGDLSTFSTISGTGNIKKFAVQEPGICDIAIDAIPLPFRTSSYATGNVHLLDPYVRQAIMMTLNKDYINNNILMGLSTPAVSVVQPGYWQADIDETETLYDPVGARDLLEAHGYEDIDSDGLLEATDSAYIMVNDLFDSKKDDIELSGIRCQAPDTDPTYWKIAQPWEGWAALAGIGFVSTLESESIMTNQAWYQADYDIWVWHWGWGPEPMGGALSCWVTSEILAGGDNCQMPMGEWWAHSGNYTTCPYINASMIDDFNMEDSAFIGFSSFDQNMSIAMHTLDKDARKVIVDDLQQMVYDSHSENPPYYDMGVYAVSELRFTGWGNWSDHNGRPITSDLLWTWFDLVPSSNQPARFDIGLQSQYQPLVDVAITYDIEVSDADGDPIMVNWSFGDGSYAFENVTGDTTISTALTQTHTYTVAQTGLYLNVTLWDHEANHAVTATARVDVLTEQNLGPTVTQMTCDYGPPGYVDMDITWTAVASDPETESPDALTVTWDWDDGTYSTSQIIPTALGADITDIQTHAWSEPGTYVVTVWVWDGFLDDPTNTEHNVSYIFPGGYDVIYNTAPTAPSVNDFSWNPSVAATITATSSDADPDVLTFTWAWDDGTYTVESIDTSGDVGATVTSTVAHTWDTEAVYDFTVWVDDGNGHNVSTTATATIVAGEVPPSSLGVAQSPYPGMVDNEVTLNASAVDGNGDALTMTIDFGDGSALEIGTTDGGVTTAQWCEFVHTYTAADTYNVTLWVDDGNSNNETDYFDVEVVENAAPLFGLQSTYTAYYNEVLSVAPVTISDADDDVLTVWYDWGDDTAMTMGDDANGYAAEHTYMSLGVFTLTAYVDDGMGHNVSAEATVTVTDANFVPTISMTVEPNVAEFEVGQTVYINVTVYDFEGDVVTVNVSFGDGKSGVQTYDTDAKVNHIFSFAHEYATADTFTVTVTAMDDVEHAIDWTSREATVDVVEPPTKGLPLALIAGIALAAIVALVAVVLLMKKRKGKKDEASDAAGGMEGMAPPQN